MYLLLLFSGDSSIGCSCLSSSSEFSLTSLSIQTIIALHYLLKSKSNQASKLTRGERRGKSVS